MGVPCQSTAGIGSMACFSMLQALSASTTGVAAPSFRTAMVNVSAGKGFILVREATAQEPH